MEKGHDAPLPPEELARTIDHTLLKATATTAEVTKLCEEARQYRFASVCVNPFHVALSAKLLQSSPVKVCTVVGFPLGATSTYTKVAETRDAVANGADEIDMVINVGALKSKDYEMVKNDIARVVEAANGRTVKVILETSLLNQEEKIKGCELSKAAGADFVKTSTGFSTGGATVEDIALMRRTVGPSMGVKASGGVKDTAIAQQMIAAGATRIGASASIAIVKGVSGGDTKGY
ncbi:MAG: deoxyribose-phosphate aldolase [Candidatus Ozemobacteraceae bacterium]